MKAFLVDIILIIFPILMYLVLSCYNSLTTKKITKLIFIVTIFTSLYLCLTFSKSKELLIYCNLPIMISYYKKESLLAIILSTIVVIYSYYQYDMKSNYD